MFSRVSKKIGQVVVKVWRLVGNLYMYRSGQMKKNHQAIVKTLNRLKTQIIIKRKKLIKSSNTMKKEE
jgi:hypothetical protein